MDDSGPDSSLTRTMTQEFTPEQGTFIRKYSKYLEEGNAALFAGAGLSRAAGFVDWKGLFGEIAGDLGLDVNLEPYPVALAQYDFNHRQNRRQRHWNSVWFDLRAVNAGR